MVVKTERDDTFITYSRSWQHVGLVALCVFVWMSFHKGLMLEIWYTSLYPEIGFGYCNNNNNNNNTGSYVSWKVVEFKSHIFQAWKVLESDLGPGNVMEMRISWCDKFFDDLSAWNLQLMRMLKKLNDYPVSSVHQSILQHASQCKRKERRDERSRTADWWTAAAAEEWVVCL